MTDNFLDWAHLFIDVSDIIQSILGIFSIYGIYSFAKDWVPKKVVLSIGTFSIRRKYFDVQNITNIVSANFFDGGQVPSNIRKEIIDITCPKIKKKTNSARK